MSGIKDKDTRYFIDIDLDTLKIVRCSFDQKENLDKGRQNQPFVHRLFLTKGQYNKFLSHCSNQLSNALEE